MIIGLDVGGAHTDVVLLGKEGLFKEIKVPTDPQELFRSILHSIEEITAGARSSQIRRVDRSTTLTTNAIVEGKIEPMGIIVSDGPGLDPQLYRTFDQFLQNKSFD